GIPYLYDADAIDLDVDDVVSFRLEAPPPGVTVDAAGVVQFLPAADDLPTYGVTLVASDGRGGEAQQSWLIHIAGASGYPDDAAPPAVADASVDDLHTGNDTSSGCSISGRGSPAPMLLLLIFFMRRRDA